MFRIGYGNDIHRLVSGRKLIIGGVEIPSEVGSDGHSDGDVLLHAITDALLGALALGDIGVYFPNTDERWLNVESAVFLRYSLGLITSHGHKVSNIDSTVSLENVKLRPYIDKMRENIAQALELDLMQVSVKAKTSEAVDAVGEGKAVRAEAVVLLTKV